MVGIRPAGAGHDYGVRCAVALGYHHLKDYWSRNKWPAARGAEYGKGGCPPAGAAMRASGCPRVLL